MSTVPAQQFSAFTSKANGIANVLLTNVDVYQPIPDQDKKLGKFVAIWDTGATTTVITPKVVQTLGLIPSGKANIRGVAGKKDNANTYYIVIVLPNSVEVNVFRAVEAPEEIAGGADILIGMDIIALGDFSVTNVDKKTTFTFRYPSVQTIDYVEEINALKRAQFKVGRNAPCPCGSRKKFKHCCGKGM